MYRRTRWIRLTLQSRGRGLVDGKSSTTTNTQTHSSLGRRQVQPSCRQSAPQIMWQFTCNTMYFILHVMWKYVIKNKSNLCMDEIIRLQLYKVINEMKARNCGLIWKQDVWRTEIFFINIMFLAYLVTIILTDIWWRSGNRDS